MEAAVYAERKAAHIKDLLDAAEGLEIAASPMDPSVIRSTMTNGAAKLRTAANWVATLGDALLPYSDPAFYKPLPPSSALEDGGEHADTALEYVFGE